ncbi:tRNA (guanine(46)-N(7))-methyltransferase TrmB [Kordiimonas aquimaris]|uniref:tRNA (guanine(46)-N(7))-methyltransferase TrmB n=1 Tax=Kordiimonas aquimaris TaxID=707591 RepID=UPI0021D26B6C|nr:hypothetical protein [Kordiimonas aquimaris]
MSENTSRSVDSNQSGIHERLADIVMKHLSSSFKRPFADHSCRVFDKIYAAVRDRDGPFILDACCGVGDSTRHLAKEFPDHLVIGLDKSLHRLSRQRSGTDPENMMLARTDLNDFYRLAVEADLKPARHYILYPNPWPKAAHLKRRWHGAPVFPSIINVGGCFELRSNWDIYLLEFQAALKLAGKTSELCLIMPEKPITPFEVKYQSDGQPLWQLTAEL